MTERTQCKSARATARARTLGVRPALPRWVALASVAWLASCAATQSNVVFTDTRWNAGAYRCVAVMPLENQSRTEGAGFAMADFLANALLTSERFRVVDRKQVQRYLDTQGFGNDPIDPGRAVEIGRALRADAVVVGSISDYWYRTLDGKPEVSMSLRIVDVQASKVVYVADGAYRPTMFSKRPFLLTSASKDVADTVVGAFTLNEPPRRLDAAECGVPDAPPPVVAGVAPPAPTPVLVAPPAPPADVVEPETPAIVASPASAPVLTPGALALLRRMSNTKSFVLETVDFELDKTSFRTDGWKDVLANLGFAMQAKPALRVRIESHTDGLGDPDFNLKLTELRAKWIKDYLVSTYAIAPARIEAVGYGGERPLLPNINRKNREANRRVELNVIEGP